MNELAIVGVRVEMPANQPLVLLKEVHGERYLPIIIGAVEATAIAYAQQGIIPARPLTHDLLRDVIAALGGHLERVVITKLDQGIFHAALVFTSGVEVSARPSDSIALAMRMEVPVYAEESVLNEAGVTAPEEHEEESEVAKFREFLDTISPDDFQTGEIGS